MPEPAPNLPTALAELHTAIRRFAAAYVAAAAPAIRAVADLAERVHAAEQDVRQPARDRPAWQAPYGPPTRRH